MIRQVVVAASIALLGISGQAVAAQSARLANVSGSVLVNQDGRFVPTKGATALRAGDRVLAMNGGATLAYADGCNVTVAPRSMATISDASPCGGSGKGITRVQYGNEGVPPPPPPAGHYHDNADLWVWLGYGVLTAAVVGAAFADDDEPVSP